MDTAQAIYQSIRYKVFVETKKVSIQLVDYEKLPALAVRQSLKSD